MSTRMLIQGGQVLTMDPATGDLDRGDVLIEDGRIASVAPHLDAEAEIVDATGCIVMPGFVDSHRHTWEAPIRGCAPDATLDDYFVDILDSYAPVYEPEDVYAGNLAGALECLNAGITTLVDWSHINNTPDHPDAAIAALRETGIRAQYAYGNANLSLADYWNDSKIAMPADDIRRVRDEYFPSGDGLLTMAMATRGPGFCSEDVVRSEWELARELGLPITVHVGMGRLAGRFAMVDHLNRLGLLREHTTYVHCCHLSDDEWRMVVDSGGNVSIAPQVEMQMGHGWPPVAKAAALGLRPSLSIDVVTSVPGDLFTQMRAAFAVAREPVNAACFEADTPVPDTMTTARQVLEMATVNGAHTAGLESKVGALVPGRRADVILIDTRDLNTAPARDPAAAAVISADVSNVDTVIVDGVPRKLHGELLADADRARRMVEESRDRLDRAVADRKATG